MQAPSNKGHRVLIVGIGGQTAIGRTGPACAAAARAGFSCFCEHERFKHASGKSVVVSRASWLPDELTLAERMVALAAATAQESLHGVRFHDDSRDVRLFIALGLPSPRPGVPLDIEQITIARLIDHLGAELAQLRLRVAGSHVTTSGHAAGLLAIKDGIRAIEAGEADLCLAGGVDSYLHPETLQWLDENEQLHGDKNRWGFIPGEGAGFCLLVGSHYAAKLESTDTLGQIVRIASARETKVIKTRTVCIGEGLTAAFKEVLDVMPSGRKIDYALADLNGEPYRADEFAFAMTRARRRFTNIDCFRTPADCWGDVGAASGPLFLTLAVEAGRRGYASGSQSFLCTSSELGDRCAATLEIPIRHREV
jgi:3-oxoacyl-[acyl-carrier-protein] synthase I